MSSASSTRMRGIMVLGAFLVGAAAISFFVASSGATGSASDGATGCASSGSTGSASGGGTKDATSAGIAPGELRPFMAIFDPSEPLFPSGERVAKEEASSRAGYEVVEPTWFPPSVESCEAEVWFSGAGNEVGLRYGSQLVLNFGEWPPGRDPAAAYESQASDWETGYTTTLGSHPAWIVPRDDRSPGQPPVNIIHLSRGNVDIRLCGRMPIDDLLNVAESMPE
ncbi:MAG TPA: hypothetical protein VEV82_08385 [Actinomycetota bacterium]|nr:hypothetical protein [Actinomycetota bacterium]